MKSIQGKKRVLLIPAILLPLAAILLQPLLDRLRRENLPRDITHLHNAPPLVAFTTVAFGGFRGIVADILWMRAAQLQMEGRYFEIVQLTDWITQLEPRSAEVWAYNAWNMTYNISVFFHEPGERWRWVRNGMALLRDRGLLYNPDAPELYFELAWLFQQKMGSGTDPAAPYYREAWSREMTALFGGGRPDYGNLPPPGALAPYRLDPDNMRGIEKRYGPLDWRQPQAHAIYWADRGLATASRLEERIRLTRMICQSLTTLLIDGYNPNQPRSPGNQPDLDLMPYAEAAYRDALEEFPGHPLIEAGAETFAEIRDILLQP